MFVCTMYVRYIYFVSFKPGSAKFGTMVEYHHPEQDIVYVWHGVSSRDCHMQANSVFPSVIRYDKIHEIKWYKINKMKVILKVFEQTIIN